MLMTNIYFYSICRLCFSMLICSHSLSHVPIQPSHIYSECVCEFLFDDANIENVAVFLGI